MKRKSRSAVERIFAPSGFRPAAILTVSGAPKMTRRGRAQIAAWLRKQTDALQADRTNYTGRFRARYLVSG